jgi:hypothetical protein
MLDLNLPKVLDLSAYQGSWLMWAAEFAMGAACAQAINDTTRWDQYCRKATAIALSAVRDYQKGGGNTRQFLTLADGTTAAFTLPDAAGSFFPASLNMYTSPATWMPVVRGPAVSNGVDVVTYYVAYIAVADNADGSSPYIQNVDWKRSSLLGDNQIQWLSGRRPVSGATYYVLDAGNLFSTLAQYTLVGNVATLKTKPAASTAIFCEYIRTDYSQTSAGDGGLDTAFVDSGGYDARYLGRSVAPVLDWCAGHPTLEAARSELSSILVAWADYLSVNGYNHASIQSNYGAGEYSSKALSAIVLAGTPNGDRLKSEVLAFRTGTVIPQLSTGLVGGFWAEGWNYGPLAIDGLLLASEAMKQSTWVDGLAERAFVSDVCEHLVYAAMAPGLVTDIGDFYSVPPVAPVSEQLYLWATQADPLKGGLLGPQTLPTGWKALALPPLPAPQPKPTPLSKFATGTGLTIARTSWTSPSTWAAMLAGNLLACDHQQFAAGHVEIWRGPDALLPASTLYTEMQNPNFKSQQSNVLVVDTNGVPNVQTYPFNQGTWYGSPGIITLAQTDDGDLCHTSADCRASYSWNQHPGDGGPLLKWIRHFLLIRSLNTVVVVDFLAMKSSAYYREQRWHTSPGPVSLSGNSFTIDRGASRLTCQVLSGQPITFTQSTLTGNGYTIPQMRFAGPAVASMAFIGVSQIGPSGSLFAPPTYFTDGTKEGCVTGNRTFQFDAAGGLAVA